MIDMEAVTVSFDGREVLKHLNVHLLEKRIGVIGNNGSGKSTFVRLLNGLQLPSSGRVKVGGYDTKYEGKRVRKQVGFVFQNPDNQIVYPIVEEDLAFGLQNYDHEKIRKTLKKFGLEHLKERLIHQLSGGEKQMIALLGVLIMEPQHIVFDEPTTLLDLRNRRMLMETILELEQQVILVTHQFDVLEKFDRVLCFHEGRIVIDDTPQKAIAEYQRMCE
ncbi:MAG: energy-coupling factor ABC transporter ATP-binding protein [Simkaniaceae bacterium]|nr:energy-coupling factor ABC transporter ATP-binding protein [Simkaniaceae bacterium]